MSKSLWNRLTAHFRKGASRHFLPVGSARRQRTARRTEPLESRVMLTPDITEISVWTDGYSVPTAGLEIEIGGLTAGNPPGGSNVDGFDQVQVGPHRTPPWYLGISEVRREFVIKT